MSGIVENESLPVFPHFVTFYSYKGGVGRTLALANTALLLVRYGRKVLVVDADLEAPGLRYIPPFDRVPHDKPGFVDLLEATLSQLPTEGGGTWLSLENQYNYPINISDFVAKIRRPGGLKAHKGGRLAYIPAGAFTPDYAKRVESLRIGQLYECGPGATIFRELKGIIAKEDYDYVLIDSRTGWSDIGGMCTRDLADTVVLVCGLNEQNVQGTKAVMHAIKKGRGEETAPGIILVASPVPNAEEKLKSERVAAMSAALGRAPDVQIFYHPLLALLETPFVGRHEESDLIGRYDGLTDRVLTQASDHTRYWLNKAVSAINNDDPETCKRAFMRASTTGLDETVTLLLQLGKMIPKEVGRPLRNRRLINRLIVDLDKNQTEENLSFGVYLGTLGRKTEDPTLSLFEEATAEFEKAAAQDTSSHEALSNWGLALYDLAKQKQDETLYEASFEKYAAALQIKPDMHEALYNWGTALYDLAKQKQDETLYEASFEKYAAALKIKPDQHEVLNNWGNALLALFQLSGRAKLLALAEEKCRQAEEIKPGAGDYNLACALALQGRSEEALDWLAAAIDHDENRMTLARKDDDLKSLQRLKRFKQITER